MKPLDPRLLRLSRSARGAVAGSALTGLVRTIATIVIAWAIAAAITEAIDADHVRGLREKITPTLVLLAVAFLVRAWAAWATDGLASRAAASVKGELRSAALARAAERGPGWLATRSSAGFATTLGPGLDALDAYFGRYLPQLVLTAIATPLLLVAIGAGDLTSGIIVICSLPVIPIFMILIGLATQTVQRRQQGALARLSTTFLEAVEGLGTLKSFGRARRQVSRIGTITDEYRRGTLSVLRLSFVSGFALELAASLSVALVAISIGIRLVDGSLGLGAALFVLVLAPEAFAPIRQVGADFHAATDGVEASTAVLDLLDDTGTGTGTGTGTEADEDNEAGSDGGTAGTPGATAGQLAAARVPVPVGGLSMPPSRGALSCTGLRITRGERVVATFDAEIRPGSVIALSGPSGAGKSSVIAALRGVLEHDGTVALDGVPIVPNDPRITWMDQRPRLVAGTIAQNVTLTANPDLTAVHSALTSAGLDLDPETALGAGGSGLSGGQAQRIAFARAAYRVSPASSVVLLDEPTSALDSEAERSIIRAIRRFADLGAVVVVASHRPAVIAAADGAIELAGPSTRVTGAARTGVHV